jgi:hypothetical protein
MRNYAEGVEAISPGLASDSAPTLGKRMKELPRSVESGPPFIQPHFGEMHAAASQGSRSFLAATPG